MSRPFGSKNKKTLEKLKESETNDVMDQVIVDEETKPEPVTKSEPVTRPVTEPESVSDTDFEVITEPVKKIKDKKIKSKKDYVNIPPAIFDKLAFYPNKTIFKVIYNKEIGKTEEEWIHQANQLFAETYNLPKHAVAINFAGANLYPYLNELMAIHKRKQQLNEFLALKKLQNEYPDIYKEYEEFLTKDEFKNDKELWNNISNEINEKKLIEERKEKLKKLDELETKE